MIASPQIRTPTENQQFNLGSVTITWDPIAAQVYLDESQISFTLDYPTDVTTAQWLDIQSWFEDAAAGGIYSGSGTSSYGNEIGPWFAANGITLDGAFTVEEIDNETGDHFVYWVKDATHVYSVASYSTSGNDNWDIVVTLLYQIQDVSASDLTYELEYTDNDIGRETNWHSFKKRIPSTDSSYVWSVGKMIKSNSIKVRMRSRYRVTEESSSWSISNQFSINVFQLTAPEIVNPVSNTLYTNFILIILDESLTRETYHQKVRYTLEYTSAKQNIDWVTIVSDIPVGQNVIRWNIEGITSSDDYSLRLTAKNNSTSCVDETESEPDQIARSFVHNIQIQQSGMFLIDTKPPEAVIEIGGNDRVTNQLNQIINIFAEDATTEVKQIQLRECNATSSLSLGNLEDTESQELAAAIQVATATAQAECSAQNLSQTDCEALVAERVAEVAALFGSGCESVEELLAGNREFDKLITDSPLGSATKVQWVFDARDANGDPVSAVKKIEALLTDVGGNTSIQDNTKVFLPIYNSEVEINDFVVVIEQRDNTTFGSDGTIDTEIATYEVVYAGTSAGELWVIEPFARYIYTIDNHPNILLIYEYSDSIYLFAYNETSDEGAIYRHDGSFATIMETFDSGSGLARGMTEYNSSLFIGLENGELWEYNGFSFTLKTTFTEPINALHGDRNYLYIGFQNSSTLTLYDGDTFFSLGIE